MDVDEELDQQQSGGQILDLDALTCRQYYRHAPLIITCSELQGGLLGLGFEELAEGLWILEPQGIRNFTDGKRRG